VGIDPRLVWEASAADLPMVTALLQKALEIRGQRDEALAVQIANAVGKLFGGK